MYTTIREQGTDRPFPCALYETGDAMRGLSPCHINNIRYSLKDDGIHTGFLCEYHARKWMETEGKDST